MLNVDFKKYSLVLTKDDKIVYSSDKSGLRPIIECINNFKLKDKDCVLYDKVIGLAAARIIVYSDIISSVYTPIISKSANSLLIKSNIGVNAQKIVENILNKDKTDVCPMELRAETIEDNKDFFLDIKRLLYP